MKFDSEYLTRQIIAYLGNKRRLLPLLHSALCAVYGDSLPEGLRFFDAFAGGGVVARLGKYLGFEVIANDWEPYSFVVNRAFVAAGPEDLGRLFGSEKAFGELLDHFNNLPDPDEADRYIARHYAPVSDDTEKADYRRERLFYTRRNALLLDAVRNEIDRLYPPVPAPGEPGPVEAREILIALLLYQAATHTNTSGVFKACHKGFGGHGKDALKRILSPIRLDSPPLIDSGHPCRVFKQDANALVHSGRLESVDVAYLDPPYNQHQYGSNYHLLNTIALWDKPPVSHEVDERGRLKEKAGIRKDWRLTKSAYCIRDKAEEAFADLLGRLNAKTILISYSTDGIIPFDVLKRLCARKGEVGIVTNEYTKYRGGRQSNTRKNTNVEFVLVVGERKPAGKAPAVDSVLRLRKVLLLFRDKYSRRRLIENFASPKEGCLSAGLQGVSLVIAHRSWFELSPPGGLHKLSMKNLGLLEKKLLASRCETKAEELEEILSNLGREDADAKFLVSFIPDIMRKLAHKKYKAVFFSGLDRLKDLRISRADLFGPLARKMEKVETIAERRFES